MTNTGVSISNWVIADSGRIARVYDITPPDAVIAKAYLTVKRKQSDSDDDALFQKEITASAGSDGQIVRADAGAASTPIDAGVLAASALSLGTGAIGLFFDVSEDDTAEARALGYLYDIQLERDSGDTYTAEIGTITFIKGITDARN